MSGTQADRSRAQAPAGFRYQADLLDSAEEQALLEHIRGLPFKEFNFQGYLARRRVVSYGWHYSYDDRTLQRAESIPDFLRSTRERAASFAGLAAEQLAHALITEYSPGTPIGWHRDKQVFGDVVGISLLSAGTFRLRRRTGSTWQRYSLTVAPRSAYLLSGASRTDWEHSIPPVSELRYSITFRSVR
jgi:alkylated DNA repair dioxygenase AlkB